MEKRMVVVTGGAGYLGSILVPLLVREGYQVRVLDRFFFGREYLAEIGEACQLIEADTRWYPAKLLDDAYAVIDLAALSNDVTGEMRRERTLDINFQARARTAQLAKQRSVPRYVLSSSCSVYGFNDEIVTEDSKPSPLTTYAEANFLAEGAVLPHSDEHFSVTVLRLGTLYGASPRMRFDLVVNAMARSLFDSGSIVVQGGGAQWRPLVHAYDAARAFVRVLQTPVDVVQGQVFNVGHTDHNFQISDIAQRVLRGSGHHGSVVVEKEAADARSYRVSCEKIARVLGFTSEHTPEHGAREIITALRTGTIPTGPHTNTIGWYKSLMAEDPDILDREHVHKELHTRVV